jgi:hypothetical protein
MRKILGIVVFAISLIASATVVLAQSSRDLTGGIPNWENVPSLANDAPLH